MKTGGTGVTTMVGGERQVRRSDKTSAQNLQDKRPKVARRFWSSLFSRQGLITWSYI